MTLALLALPALAAPLQYLFERTLRPWRAQPRGQQEAAGPGPRRSPAAAAPARPLRVVRVLEAGGANRLVISGRMADVCAELDRLAALEAAAH